MAATTPTQAKIFSPIAILIASWLAYTGFIDRGTAARLQSEGVEVSGDVTGTRIKSGRKGSKTYLLEARYAPSVGGPAAVKEFSVSQATFERVQGGGSIKIRYLPSDPTTAEVSGDGKTGVGTLVAAGFILVLGLIFGYYGYVKTEF